MLTQSPFALLLSASLLASSVSTVASAAPEEDDFADFLNAEVDKAGPVEDEPQPEPEPEPEAEPEPEPETSSAVDMTDEQRLEKAKALFMEADSSFQAGDFKTALSKFEEAYNVYAPDLHVFNINIGLAAYELGDCVKAKVALQRFLDLAADHPSRPTAQEKLLEIDRSGCANKAAEPEPEPVPEESATPATDDEDAPVLTARSKEREDAAAKERQVANSKKKPLLIAGSVLTALGLAAIGGGVGAFIIADNNAQELQQLSSPGNTGFPAGDYSEQEVYDLDRNSLPAANISSIALFAGGGALTATGIALIVVHSVRAKKARTGGSRANQSGSKLGAVGPWGSRGQLGLSATVRF